MDREEPFTALEVTHNGTELFFFKKFEFAVMLRFVNENPTTIIVIVRKRWYSSADLSGWGKLLSTPASQPLHLGVLTANEQSGAENARQKRATKGQGQGTF